MASHAAAHSPLQDIPPIDKKTGLVNVIIDTPRGSRCKNKYDEKTGCFRLKKLLPRGADFPYDFGFIPGTRGDDGDPLDVLVLSEEPIGVGLVVPVRLIGALEAKQTEEDGTTVRNDRLIGVVETEHNPPEVKSIHQVSKQELAEIEHFFVSYNEIEGKKFELKGRVGPKRAARLVKKGMKRDHKEQK